MEVNDAVDQQTSQTQENVETPKATELEALSEFSFGGEKLTPDQLQKIMSEHKSYQTQVDEYSKDKKFQDNLEADIDSVLSNPNLASKFKQIYPQKYHGILDRLLKTSSPGETQENKAAPSSLPKEFLNEFNEMKEWKKFQEQRTYQAEVESANAKLDAVLPPMFKKYPMASEDQVYARAESILAKDQKMTDATWERLIRESHEAFVKRADQYHGEKIKTQLEKGKQGKDIGIGGATPGQAPKRAKNFDQAYEEMMSSLKNG